MTAHSEIAAEVRTADVRGQALVTAAWLAAHLSDPDVRVVEVDVSPGAYDSGHVDGAVLWNVYQDLKGADYRLKGTAALAGLLASSEIRPETTVVFYGYAPAMGFWLMRLLGHRHMCVLDCSRETWRSEGRPWSTTATEPGSATSRISARDDDVRADRALVRDAIGRVGTRLLDVRSAAEYHGERFWPSGAPEPSGRAGHIPTAIHRPIEDLYDPRGAFRTVEKLRALFSASELDSADQLITYCAIGARAATAWFVLTYLLGRDGVRVYDGSWAEWGRTTGLPIDAP